MKETSIKEIEMNKIKIGNQQPRAYLDPQKIKSLANDIKENGLLQPIVVRKKGESYEIICGHRRYEAHKQLNAKTIKCIITEMNDTNAFFTSLRENLQREDMSLFDEARAYKKLITDGFTQTDISKKLNISQAKISQALAISKFDDIPDFHFYNINENKVCKENAVESAIISQLITPSHAQELLKLVRFFEEVGLEKDMWFAPLFFKIDEITCKDWSTGDLRYAIDDYICGFVDHALIKKSIYFEGGNLKENKPDHIDNPMLNKYKIPFKYIEMALKFHAKHGDFKEDIKGE